MLHLSLAQVFGSMEVGTLSEPNSVSRARPTISQQHSKVELSISPADLELLLLIATLRDVERGRFRVRLLSGSMPKYPTILSTCLALTVSDLMALFPLHVEHKSPAPTRD